MSKVVSRQEERELIKIVDQLKSEKTTLKDVFRKNNPKSPDVELVLRGLIRDRVINGSYSKVIDSRVNWLFVALNTYTSMEQSYMKWFYIPCREYEMLISHNTINKTTRLYKRRLMFKQLDTSNIEELTADYMVKEGPVRYGKFREIDKMGRLCDYPAIRIPFDGDYISYGEKRYIMGCVMQDIAERIENLKGLETLDEAVDLMAFKEYINDTLIECRGFSQKSMIYMHHLIAFILNFDAAAKGLIQYGFDGISCINHINLHRYDFRPENLEFCSYKDNFKHSRIMAEINKKWEVPPHFTISVKDIEEFEEAHGISGYNLRYVEVNEKAMIYSVKGVLLREKKALRNWTDDDLEEFVELQLGVQGIRAALRKDMKDILEES